MCGKLRYGLHKTTALLLLLLIGFPVLLSAQEDGDDSDTDEWEGYFSELYSFGDQTFVISLGTIFPILFFNNRERIELNFSPSVGGVGTLNYNFYFHSRFFVGGEVSGMFIRTLRDHTLFIVPLGIKAGTQFIVNRFEFPISASFGMVWHSYLDFGYYGIFLKGTASAYFRAINDWSFGLSTNWYWFPQRTENKSNNVNGHFIDIMLSARYHF